MLIHVRTMNRSTSHRPMSYYLHQTLGLPRTNNTIAQCIVILLCNVTKLTCQERSWSRPPRISGDTKEDQGQTTCISKEGQQIGGELFLKNAFKFQAKPNNVFQLIGVAMEILMISTLKTWQL